MRLWTVLLILIFACSAFGQGYLGNTILEGETKEVMVSDRIYEITLVTVSDARGVALFKVNGELSDELSDREKHRFSDGSEIFVSNVFPNEGAEVGGADLVQFYFMATGGSLARPAVTRETSPVGYEDVVTMLEDLTQSPAQDVQRPSGSYECVVDYDCDDGAGCTADGCIGGQCVHIPQGGCSFDSKVCVSYNTRMVLNELARFCGEDGQWKLQVPLGASCMQNYECTSNLCIGGYCSEVKENGELVQAAVARPAPIAEPTVPPQVVPTIPPDPELVEPEIRVVATQDPTEESASERPSIGGFFRWLLSSIFF